MILFIAERHTKFQSNSLRHIGQQLVEQFTVYDHRSRHSQLTYHTGQLAFITQVC